ncbi:MAG: hypothetical protein WAL27_13430 [Cellulosimicrobium cellulans]
MTDDGTVLPASVQIDAWSGKRAVSPLAPDARRWGAKPGLPTQKPLKFDKPPDPTDWESDEVGYGILVPDSPTAPDTGEYVWTKEKATGSALPEPVRRLLKARPKTVLLYWNPLHGNRFVRRYFDSDPPHTSDLRIGLSQFGTDRKQLPRFVLIAASPTTIPWGVQYSLALRHAVGRLPFDDNQGAAYVSAMLDGAGWATSPPTASNVAVWTVNHGTRDITHLMQNVLTKPLIEKCEGTIEKLTVVDGADATTAGLVSALASKPTLLVTSSHGATPLDERELVRDLGLPVARNHTPVDIDALVESVPGGAVWFAQACCSAGSSRESSYAALLEEGTMARLIVDTVAGLTSSVSPAPLALLTRQIPVRAVFGHVEPTFDWTLRDPGTKQRFGHDIISGLTSQLHSGQPLGLILENYYSGVGSLVSAWATRSDEFQDSHDREILAEMTRLRLTAWDRQSLVLLGDPTVRIPKLAEFDR